MPILDGMPPSVDVVGLGGVYAFPDASGSQPADRFAAPDQGGGASTNNGGYIHSLGVNNPNFSNLSNYEESQVEGQLVSGSLVPIQGEVDKVEPSADFVYVGRWRGPAHKNSDALGSPSGPGFFQFVAGKPVGDSNLLANATQTQPWLQYSLADPATNSYVTAKRPDGSVDYDAGYFDNARLLLDPYTASAQLHAQLGMNAYGSQNEQTFYTLQGSAPLNLSSTRVDTAYSALCTPHCTNDAGKFSAMAFATHAGIALSFSEANLGDIYGTAALGFNNSTGYGQAEGAALPHEIGGLQYLMAPLSKGSISESWNTLSDGAGLPVKVRILNGAAIAQIGISSDPFPYFGINQPLDANGDIGSTAIGYQGSLQNTGGSANANADFAYLGTWSVPNTNTWYQAPEASVFVLGVASPWASVQSKGQEQGGTLSYNYSPGSNPGTVIAVRPDTSVDQMAGTLNSAQIQVDTSLAKATVSASLDLNAYNGVAGKNLTISSNPITTAYSPADLAMFTGNIFVTDTTVPVLPVSLPGTHSVSGMIMNVDANSLGQAGLVMRFTDPDMGQIGAGAILQGTVP